MHPVWVAGQMPYSWMLACLVWSSCMKQNIFVVVIIWYSWNFDLQSQDHKLSCGQSGSTSGPFGPRLDQTFSPQCIYTEKRTLYWSGKDFQEENFVYSLIFFLSVLTSHQGIMWFSILFDLCHSLGVATWSGAEQLSLCSFWPSERLSGRGCRLLPHHAARSPGLMARRSPTAELHCRAD